MGVNWFPFLFYLQIPIFRKTQRELSERETRPHAERERGRTQKSPTQIIVPDRIAGSSSTQIVVPDHVAFPENQSSLNHIVVLDRDLACRRTQSRSQHQSASEISPVVEPNRDRSMNFFFLGVICVSGLRNEIIIFVWQRRKSEKMWARSRKCIFHGIFNNTTKHQKIFFTIFSQIQPNTWKYFPFRKIAFQENKYFPENILREPNTA